MNLEKSCTFSSHDYWKVYLSREISVLGENNEFDGGKNLFLFCDYSYKKISIQKNLSKYKELGKNLREDSWLFY